MIQIILKTKTLIYKPLKCNHAVLVFLRSSNRLTKKSIITLNLAYKQGMEMLKSIFNHVLSPFFNHLLAKMALKSKKYIFFVCSLLYWVSEPVPKLSLLSYLYSTRTIILCKYQKIGLFVNFLFHYWWFLKISSSITIVFSKFAVK